MKFKYLLAAILIGFFPTLYGCTGASNHPSNDAKIADKQTVPLTEQPQRETAQPLAVESKNDSGRSNKQAGSEFGRPDSQNFDLREDSSRQDPIVGDDAQNAEQKTNETSSSTPDDEEEMYATPLPKIDEGWQRLHPRQELWIDVENKTVIVGGRISLRAGMLEMFACPRNTKEHESVVSANARPELIHAALLALEIEPGSPARFDPEYETARGPKLEIVVRFDRDGQVHEVRSQELVRYLKTKEELDLPWIFAGSEYIDDWNSDRKIYSGNSGSFICVSNFPDATIDIPVRSSDDMSNLMFEANTEKIPPLGTRVLLLIRRAPEEEVENSSSGKIKTDE